MRNYTTPVPRGGGARWSESRDASPGLGSPPLPGLRQTLAGRATISSGIPHAQHSGDRDPSLALLPNLKSVSSYSITPPPEQQQPTEGLHLCLPLPLTGASLQLALSVAGKEPGCWPLEPGCAGAAAQTGTGFSGQFSFSINAWGLGPAPPLLLVSVHRPACDGVTERGNPQSLHPQPLRWDLRGLGCGLGTSVFCKLLPATLSRRWVNPA